MLYNLHTSWEVLFFFFFNGSHCIPSPLPPDEQISQLWRTRCEEVSCWLAPRDRISALSELLCISMAGVALVGNWFPAPFPAFPGRQSLLSSHHHEDHYSRQQEEWISQLNILLDYPANPFLWVRTVLGLKSLKTKQHRSSNIWKQGNGQPQGSESNIALGKNVMGASLGAHNKARGPVSWLHVKIKAKLIPTLASYLGLFDVNAFSNSQQALFILHCLFPTLLCQNCSTELSCWVCWKVQANCLWVAN